MEELRDIVGSKFPVLRQIGIETFEQLTKEAASRKGRRNLSSRTQIEEEEILEWMNRIDLMRISDIDKHYADLLEESGVDTVVELSRRKPENLHERLLETLEEIPFIVNEKPTLSMIESWIRDAKTKGRLIEY